MLIHQNGNIFCALIHHRASGRRCSEQLDIAKGEGRATYHYICVRSRGCQSLCGVLAAALAVLVRAAASHGFEPQHTQFFTRALTAPSCCPWSPTACRRISRLFALCLESSRFAVGVTPSLPLLHRIAYKTTKPGNLPTSRFLALRHL